MAKNSPVSYPDTHHDATSNTLFGFWIYLMTDFILFAALFAVYAVLYTSTAGGPALSTLFSLPRALTETLLLLVSSFSCGMALLSVPRNKVHTLLWFAVTFLLGAAFLTMECSEFSTLLAQGSSWKKNAALSAYFTLLGTHGLHIAFGLLFLVIFSLQLLFQGFTTTTIRRLTCLSLFWFFSYVVWIFMFTFVYLIGAA